MDIAKSLELIEKSNHIALLLSPEPDFDMLASAEVIMDVLEARGKIVGLACELKKELLSDLDQFPKISSSPVLLKEFIVSLDTAHHPISQLRYEKEEGRIDIIFSPQKGPIGKEAVSFRDGKALCDLAIAIGIANPETLELPTPEFLSETPIINLDISPENKQYGEVNILDRQKGSLAELAYDFLTSLSSSPIATRQADILLAAIVRKSDHFRAASTAADTLLTASELMRLGAELVKTKNFSSNNQPPALVQLAGRASVRSRLDDPRGILWSFLTAEDFEKTGRTSEDVPYVLGHLTSQFPPHRAIALLLQEPESGSVRAALAGGQPLLSALEQRGAGKYSSSHLLLHARFETFKEGEEIIASLLEEVL